MPQILVEDLAKIYRVAERDPGLLGAVKGLVHRRHRRVEALRDVSFSLEAGELLGFIGPNGAGKSTTIKILSGILKPDAGVVRVNGRVPFSDRIAHVSRIGVVFGQTVEFTSNGNGITNTHPVPTTATAIANTPVCSCHSGSTPTARSTCIESGRRTD